MELPRFSKLSILFASFSILLNCCWGVRLPACSGDNDAIELTENQAGQTVRCEDIANNQQIQWTYGGDPIVTCNSPNETCTNNNAVIFTGSRDSTSSTLTVVISAARPVGSGFSFSGAYFTCRPVGESGQTCIVDIVYSPTSNNVSCSVTSNEWNVIVSCDVTKAYSSLNRYTCDFRVTSAPDNSLGEVSYSSGSSTSNYVTGTCERTVTMPTSGGSHTYSVIIYPGVQSITAGTVSVVAPSGNPSISCTTQNGYVIENTALTCTCTSNLGQPQGRLRVYRGNTLLMTGNQGDSDVEFGESSVDSDDNGTVYRCELLWGPQNTMYRQTTYTLQVAYGPSRTELDDPPVYELDPSQSSSALTLTCRAVEVNPSATYSWSGSECSDVTQSTCSFTPTKDNNDDIISCTSVNPISRVSNTSPQRTLVVHYPPINAPVISNKPTLHVYSGQEITMTCTVQGGNPPVKGVTFTCETQGGQKVSGVNGTIRIMASRNYNGSPCICGANWQDKNPSWYTQTDNVTLDVYYSPDPPNIDFKQQAYPFLAGDTPTLYCNLTDPGHPPANLTLQGHTGGHSEVSVTLAPLTKEDNGRRVACRADNAFTKFNNTPVVSDTRLDVYFLTSDIQSLSDACSMTSPVTCVVREGQRVHVNCSAESNPPIATVAWQPDTGSVLNFVANRTSMLSHTCHINTSTVGSDGRLPLRDSINLTVLTTYGAEINEFYINNSSNVTVSEGHHVTLTCIATGRPQPEMKIVKNGVTLKSKEKQPVTPKEQETLTYQPQVTCDDTGQFRCDVDNDEGAQNSRHVVVFVKCSPRLQPGTKPLPTYLNYNNDITVNLTIPLTAYPTPQTHSLHYLGPNSTLQQPARTTLYNLHCVSEDPSREYRSTCTLVLSNATQDDKGFYNLSLDNQVQQPFYFVFQLDVNGTEPVSEKSSDFPIAAAVGGCVAAIVVIVVVAVAVIIVRRRQTNKKSGSHSRQQSRRREPEEPEMIVNSLYGTAGPRDAGTQAATRPPGSAYEDVDVGEAGPVVNSSPAPPAAATGAAYTEGAADTGVEYAVVNKQRRAGPDPAPSTTAPASDDTNVYAVVNKTKKAPNSASDQASTSRGATPDTKPKPNKKPKPQKPKDKPKGKKTDKPGNGVPPQEPAVYGNTSQPEGTVYANYGFQDEEGAVGGTPDQGSGEEADDNGRTVNDDGLVYTKIDFNDSQKRRAQNLPPKRERTEYVDISLVQKARQNANK